MYMQILLKFGTKCIILHPAFPGIAVVEAITRVCKGSWSKTTPELPTLCKEGEQIMHDAPPNFSRDPKVGPIMNQRKKKRVGACSLIRNISGVGGHAKVLRWN